GKEVTEKFNQFEPKTQERLTGVLVHNLRDSALPLLKAQVIGMEELNQQIGLLEENPPATNYHRATLEMFRSDAEFLAVAAGGLTAQAVDQRLTELQTHSLVLLGLIEEIKKEADWELQVAVERSRLWAALDDVLEKTAGLDMPGMPDVGSRVEAIRNSFTQGLALLFPDLPPLPDLPPGLATLGTGGPAQDQAAVDPAETEQSASVIEDQPVVTQGTTEQSEQSASVIEDQSAVTEVEQSAASVTTSHASATAAVTGTNQNQAPDQSQAQVPDQNQTQAQDQTQGQNQVQGQGRPQVQVTVPAPVDSWQLEFAFNRRSSGLWTHSVLLDELAGALAVELLAAIGEGRPTPKVVVGGFGRTAQERAARQARAQVLADYLRTMTNG